MTRTPRALFAVSVLCLASATVGLGIMPGCAGRPPVARPVMELTETTDAGPAGSTTLTLRKDADFSPSVPSLDVWQTIAARPATATLAGAEVVKTIYDRTDGKLYFLQSERWPIHYYFARRFLSTPEHRIGDEGVFNKMEYHQPGRRFVLGSLTRYPGDVWAWELYAGDELDVGATADVFRVIQKSVFFGDKLRYRPVPLAHQTDARTRTLLPVVETAEIFGHVTYQALEVGEAYGYLRVFAPGQVVDQGKLRPFDIVVLGTLPEDLPVVSGVISEELQAPLGHINVLCHNRRTPNMAVRSATSRDDVKSLAGKLVHLSVDPQGFRLEAATQAAAEASWNEKRPKQAMSPPRDDRDVGLPELSRIGLADIPRVGAKAAQLGLVTQVAKGKFRVPKGFALPMHAYARFLAKNGFDKRIDAMLGDTEFARDPELRRRRLDDLRAEMEKAPVPDDVTTPLLKRIAEVLPPGKVRFRSSTNAEDLPGFNGAGLYRSTRADPKTREAVEDALRKVWSSVWLWGAYEERAFYRIDSHTVGMAILVQESVDDDVINGVAVTENPFSQGQPGYFVNAQLSQGGGSVTGARGDEVPEQVMIYHYEDGQGVERLSTSSRAGGKPILSAADLEALRRSLEAVHLAFTGDAYGMSGRAVDVEFLVAGPSREVVIVQARPFQVVWTKERRYLDDAGRPANPQPRLLPLLRIRETPRLRGRGRRGHSRGGARRCRPDLRRGHRRRGDTHGRRRLGARPRRAPRRRGLAIRRRHAVERLRQGDRLLHPPARRRGLGRHARGRRILRHRARLHLRDLPRPEEHQAARHVGAHEERHPAHAELRHETAWLGHVHAGDELGADAVAGRVLEQALRRHDPAAHALLVEEVRARLGVDGVGHPGWPRRVTVRAYPAPPRSRDERGRFVTIYGVMKSSPPVSREMLIPVVAALLAAERRIAMLERRLYDARWIGPGEEPNARDKAVAKQRVAEAIGTLVGLAEGEDDVF